jgi:LssY C-terminus
MKRAVATLLFMAAFVLGPSSVAAKVLPAGTRLEVRLSVSTGSRISHPGDHVEGVVIAPVFDTGELLIPQGSIISGVVQNVERVGLGLKHLTSGIEYRFESVQQRDGTAIPVEARVFRVETAKERVNAHGVIGGIYPTANLSSSAAFYVLPLLCVDPEFGVPMLGIKFLIARSPDPEIYFPAGTEVILELTRSADFPTPGVPTNHIASLSASELADVHGVLSKLPEQRTDRGRNHPSDLVNILLLGSRESINRAFQAAGWTGAQRSSIRSIYRMYHCMVQRMGYSMAPMGRLTLNGMTADAEYQKSLNTFSKRHHVRLWKQAQKDAWLSAATEDVSYKFVRMHLTHATDPLIDNERAKVLNDLAFTGCLDAASLMPRDSSDATHQDGSIRTDGKIAVLRINDCREPRRMPTQSAQTGPRGRKRSAQALLALRNDLIRTNPISLAYSTIRALRANTDSQADGPLVTFNSNRRKTDASASNMPSAWMRPIVVDATNTANHAHP